MHAFLSFIGLVMGSPCTIHTIMCANHSEFTGKQFADEAHVQAEHVCYRRANSFNEWCKNPPGDEITVTASFSTTGKTQFFSPNACDPGWILFDDSCYLYNMEYMNWTSANKFCASHSSALVSIHSPLENDFLHSLTGGLSTWIGFADVRTDPNAVEDYRWIDNSQVDYRNWNTSDSPETDKGKEWHEWDNRDPAPCICKKPSLNRQVGIRASITSAIPIPVAQPEETRAFDETQKTCPYDLGLLNFGSMYNTHLFVHVNKEDLFIYTD